MSFNSDRLWSYELGAKADLGGIYAGASLFRIDWSGIQQLISLPNCGFSYVDNLGAARSRGFEAELEGRPTEALRLAAGIGFVDARFQGTLLGGTPVAGGERSVIVEEGDRVPYVPRWTLRLAAEYRRPVGLSLKGYFRVGYQYSSDHKRAPSTRAAGYNPLTYRGEAYGNVLLRAGLEGRGWLVSVFAENLLNDRSVIFSSADFVPVTGAPLRQTTLRPRTIGIAVSLNY